MKLFATMCPLLILTLSCEENLDHKDRILQKLKSPPMLFHLFNYFFLCHRYMQSSICSFETKVQCNVLVKHKKCIS